MAKSKSFFGLRRGSTKSLTFQVLNGQQITKDRVTQVRNPKTSGQIMQRMKLSAANVIYRYFKRYIDRGQQGVTYGNLSRNAWLKQIMSGETLYNPKGATRLLPWSFPMTKGSLVPFNYDWEGNVTNLILDAEAEAGSTVEAITDADVLANNAQLLDGDQITVICLSQGLDGNYTIKQCSHILGDGTDWAGQLADAGIVAEILAIGDVPAEGEEDTRTWVTRFNAASGFHAGCCVILSRLNGSAYERSTQSFLGNPETFTNIFRNLAIMSYRDSSAQSTDWPEVFEDGFIPYGKLAVAVHGTSGNNEEDFSALAVYGFSGNDYRLYLVKQTVADNAMVYKANETLSDFTQAQLSIGQNQTGTTYFYGAMSKADYDKYFG